MTKGQEIAEQLVSFDGRKLHVGKASFYLSKNEDPAEVVRAVRANVAESIRLLIAESAYAVEFDIGSHALRCSGPTPEGAVAMYDAWVKRKTPPAEMQQIMEYVREEQRTRAVMDACASVIANGTSVQPGPSDKSVNYAMEAFFDNPPEVAIEMCRAWMRETGISKKGVDGAESPPKAEIEMVNSLDRAIDEQIALAMTTTPSSCRADPAAILEDLEKQKATVVNDACGQVVSAPFPSKPPKKGWEFLGAP